MKKNKRAKIKDLVCIMQNNEFRAFLLEKKLFSSELIIDQCIKTCSGSYEIIFLSFLIVPCHLQAKTYFYFNTNLHHEDERNACSKNHINKTVFCPLFNAKNRMSLSLLVLPLAFLLMSPYIHECNSYKKVITVLYPARQEISLGIAINLGITAYSRLIVD